MTSAFVLMGLVAGPAGDDAGRRFAENRKEWAKATGSRERAPDERGKLKAVCDGSCTGPTRPIVRHNPSLVNQLTLPDCPVCSSKSLLAALVLLSAAGAGAARLKSLACQKSTMATRSRSAIARIRLGGIDAPSSDQLCLNTMGERWTCGIAARDELAKHVGNKSWTCHTRQTTDRRGRIIARCEVDGEDIQKWLVATAGRWPFVRISHDYVADEKAAHEAKAGMWQGAFIAPWDWRVRNKKTTILGAAKPPPERPCDPAGICVRTGRALARLHHQGQCQHIRRMHFSPADQPLVRQDPDENQQGHALVLLGRGRRSRRLPRDQKIGMTFSENRCPLLPIVPWR